MVSIPFPMAKDMKENGFKTSNMVVVRFTLPIIINMWGCGFAITNKATVSCITTMATDTKVVGIKISDRVKESTRLSRERITMATGRTT